MQTLPLEYPHTKYEKHKSRKIIFFVNILLDNLSPILHLIRYFITNETCQTYYST